jgi:hypothetical protein
VQLNLKSIPLNQPVAISTNTEQRIKRENVMQIIFILLEFNCKKVESNKLIGFDVKV